METQPNLQASRSEAGSIFERLPLVSFVMDAYRRHRQEQLAVRVLDGIVEARQEYVSLHPPRPASRTIGKLSLS